MRSQRCLWGMMLVLAAHTMSLYLFARFSHARLLSLVFGFALLGVHPIKGVELASSTLRVSGVRSGEGIEFASDNPVLQRIFDAIVLANLKNEARMPNGKRVLVEGDIWRGIWFETQH